MLYSSVGIYRLGDICNSAPAPQSVVVVNADCFTQDQMWTALTLFYSTDEQQTWDRLNMSRIGTPGYESTYAVQLLAPATGNGFYYLRAESPSGASTLSPFNSGNSWPPPLNLLALATDDPVGDALSPEGDWLDLTGAWVGYSGDRFYALLTNNYNSWPLYTFPQPWYIYSIGFVNPEAPSDSFVFALCYANIPAVFTTGLYLINRYTADYSRIADIDAQTSANRLYLRALISSFTSHPKFGPWPNNCGYLAVAATTQSIYPLGGNQLRDTTLPVAYYAGATPLFTVGSNESPVLSAPTVTPRTGPPGSKFLFSVRYQDADNNLPVERAVIIDSTNYELIPNSHRYQNGVQFRSWLTGFNQGWHRFHFRFSDGVAVVSSQGDSFYVGSVSVVETERAAEHKGAGQPTIFRSRLRILIPDAVAIYNRAGRCVCRLKPGSEYWDGCDDRSNPLPAGVYYLLTASRRIVPVVKLSSQVASE
jgi:hypothetical protein